MKIRQCVTALLQICSTKAITGIIKYIYLSDQSVFFFLRMLTCAQLTMEDFYVIHHEMGHIMYYMAYEDQPTIFQVTITHC